MSPLLIARFTSASNRFLDLSVGTFVHFLGISDERIQRRGDDLLRRDGINEQQQPGSQRFDRRHGLGELPLCCGQLFHLRPINRLDQFLARWKVAIQSSRLQHLPVWRCRPGWHLRPTG